MSLYFIDFQDGEKHVRDSVGSAVASIAEACVEAAEMLPQIAKNRRPSNGSWDLTATVRDEVGTVLYRATLSFHDELVARG